MILAILQARMTSSRLPGKVLKNILGSPMLEMQIERIRRCKKIEQLVIATSNNREDDPIEALCKTLNVDCFRGDLANVLDRFYQASLLYHPRHIVRLTGDCPLTDPAIIDALIELYQSCECDYANTGEVPTLPDGLDAEIFSFESLEQAWREAELPSHLEHVTLFIRALPDRFKPACFRYHRDLSHLRWVVDEPEDLAFVRKVYEKLYPSKPEFDTEDIMALLERKPELIEINRHFKRNAGLQASLQMDRRIGIADK